MAALADDLSWMQSIQTKLADVFQGREEDLCRVLLFLDEEESAYQNNRLHRRPHWEFLRSTLNNDEAFRIFARKLSEDTMAAEELQSSRYRWNTALELVAAVGGVVGALGNLPRETQNGIGDVMRQVFGKGVIVNSATDKGFGILNKNHGTFVMVHLAAAYLSYKALRHIPLWRRGKIGFKDCAKNLIDDTIAVVVGLGGGFGGAAVGALAGPWQSVFGGLVGGWVAGAGGTHIQYIWNFLV